MTITVPHDPALDLVIERLVDVPPALVWRAWTEAAHLRHWFCPKPWTTDVRALDLRPGGLFHAVLEGPDGTRAEHRFCYLEVQAPHRLVWTTALEPGFRPTPAEDSGGVPHFTAVITIEPHGAGTKYSALAMHRDPAGAARHVAMGFHDGWGTVTTQLADYARTLAR